MAERTGLEPAHPFEVNGLANRGSTNYAYLSKNGERKRTRTFNLQFRRLLLYPAELCVHMVGKQRLELYPTGPQPDVLPLHHFPHNTINIITYPSGECRSWTYFIESFTILAKLKLQPRVNNVSGIDISPPLHLPFLCTHSHFLLCVACFELDSYPSHNRLRYRHRLPHRRKGQVIGRLTNSLNGIPSRIRTYNN